MAGFQCEGLVRIPTPCNVAKPTTTLFGSLFASSIIGWPRSSTPPPQTPPTRPPPAHSHGGCRVLATATLCGDRAHYININRCCSDLFSCEESHKMSVLLVICYLFSAVISIKKIDVFPSDGYIY